MGTYVRRPISGADNCKYQKNRSFCHTSTKIGMYIHHRMLIHKKTLATRISQMAAIFQDGRHFRYAFLRILTQHEVVERFAWFWCQNICNFICRI